MEENERERDYSKNVRSSCNALLVKSEANTKA
jgi:hypothetical protein